MTAPAPEQRLELGLYFTATFVGGVISGWIAARGGWIPVLASWAVLGLLYLVISRQLARSDQRA